MNHKLEVEKALQRLKAAGFKHIQDSQIPLPVVAGKGLIAWAPENDGELRPHTFVLIMEGIPEAGLPYLTRVKNELSTREHYIVTKGSWFIADDHLESLKAIDRIPSAPEGDGILSDKENLARILVGLIKRDLSGNQVSSVKVIREKLKEVSDQGTLPFFDGSTISVNQNMVRSVVKELLERDSMLRVRADEQLLVDPVIAKAMANLGAQKPANTVLDPFVGLGVTLASLAAELQFKGLKAEYVGIEIEPETAQLTRLINYKEISIDIQEADSFSTDIPKAELILTVPPFGRFERKWELLNNQTTREIHVAALDLCLRALSEHGRLIIQLPYSFTTSPVLEAYRQYLAENYRVAAIIGLPSGAVTATVIRTVLLVVEKEPPTDTFVSQLGDDWREQLSTTSSFMEALKEHLLQEENGNGDE
ncbi:hypothetical protein BSR28_06925 [Boudabousia liubingyangii]|uniref:HsdM family class I SAM-dependent methyltransferase n=1 Tax=Boudabousia liubingyangii TaxID=1921764 RepID=UPI00093C8A1A|nr:N-6 DNA methylase [Boudabousia liubingyangii]OKL46267.1 hypothetical protein BSR28_06925 [Boudabousia liubingyangii]